MSASQWSVDSMRGVGSQPCIIVAPEHAPAQPRTLCCRAHWSRRCCCPALVSPQCRPRACPPWSGVMMCGQSTTQHSAVENQSNVVADGASHRPCLNSVVVITKQHSSHFYIHPHNRLIYCLPTLHLSCCSWSSLALASPSTCFSRSSVCSAASLVWCSSTCRVDV